MTKARELADLGSVTTRLDEVGNTDGALSNRNLIINGAMQVAQRGTSVTNVGSNGYYTQDRWQFEGGLTDSFDLSTSTGPAGFPSAIKMSRSTSETLDASDYAMVAQKIEAQNLQHLEYGESTAKSITISFWVKSTATGDYALNLYSDNSGSARIATKTYSISSSNTWEYKTLTFEGDTAGQINNDNGVGMYVQFFVRAGSTYSSGSPSGGWEAFSNAVYAGGHTADFMASANGSWEITGVQLEVGDTATPFEHRSYGDELQRCQRYYYQKDYSVNQYEPIKFPCWSGSTSTLIGEWVHPVTMRANPSLSHNGVGNFRLNDSRGNDQVCTSINRTGGNVNETWITFGGANATFTIGYSGYMNTQLSNDAQLYFDAEL